MNNYLQINNLRKNFVHLVKKMTEAMLIDCTNHNLIVNTWYN